MPRSWLVKSENVKLHLDLPGEEWIEVKTALTAGEKRRITFAGFSSIKTEAQSKKSKGGAETGVKTEINVNWDDLELERILTVVTDWSFVDHDEKPLPLTRSVLDRLDDEAYQSIKRKLDEYYGEQEEKKALSSANESPARLKTIS